jgi:NADH:ubiquinone oxidoreductase subunit E
MVVNDEYHENMTAEKADALLAALGRTEATP